MIASGTLALLTHRISSSGRADPTLLPGAVEELLRFVNPINHASERFTLEPVSIAGVTIPPTSGWSARPLPRTTTRRASPTPDGST